MSLPLYLVERTDRIDYEEFDSYVVATDKTIESLEAMCPSLEGELEIYSVALGMRYWTKDLTKVKVTKIADSSIFTEETVVIASFNAG